MFILSNKKPEWEDVDVINGNDITMYDKTYDSNGELTEKLSKVNTI